MSAFAYILRCADGACYYGSTTDLSRHQHRCVLGLPAQLVHHVGLPSLVDQAEAGGETESLAPSLGVEAMMRVLWGDTAGMADRRKVLEILTKASLVGEVSALEAHLRMGPSFNKEGEVTGYRLQPAMDVLLERLRRKAHASVRACFDRKLLPVYPLLLMERGDLLSSQGYRGQRERFCAYSQSHMVARTMLALAAEE